MNSTITTTASQLVDAFGSTAHSAIDAARAGGERLGSLAAQRWDHAFRQASPQLSAETRRNAANARKVFARCWRQGLTLSTEGAERAVDTFVQVAGSAIERADAWQQARAQNA